MAKKKHAKMIPWQEAARLAKRPYDAGAPVASGGQVLVRAPRGADLKPKFTPVGKSRGKGKR